MPRDGPRTDDRLRALINQIVAFVAVLDVEGILKDVDDAALERGGLRLDDVVGKPFEQTYWWSYDEAVMRQLRADIAAAAAGETVRREALARVADDGRLPIFLQVGPLRDASGKVVEIIASATDISLQKDNEHMLEREREELALLNKELRHRVKNLFAIVQATLSWSARQAQDKTQMLDLAQSRIGALASSHMASMDSVDYREVEIDVLVNSVVASQSPAPASLDIEGPPITLSSDATTPLTLILHELATNAAKHGAWRDERGTVCLEWRLASNTEEGAANDRETDTVTLVWRESHPTGSANRRIDHANFGTTLIQRCARQLGGEVSQHPERAGWVTSLRFPVRAR